MLDDPYRHIQDGIDAACNGIKVIVAEGIYYENINFNNKNIILTSSDPNDPNVVANTIIDGSQPADPNLGAAVTFEGGEEPNCVLTGFTITGGTGNYFEIPGWPRRRYWGGGVCLKPNASPTITKNIITGNTAVQGGANICCVQGNQARITFNIIEDGNCPKEDSYGGGIYCDNFGGSRTTGPFIAYNFIINNRAANGAAITCGYGTNATIFNNICSGNQAKLKGGAIFVDVNDATMVFNNTVTDNNALYGSAIHCYKNNLSTITNNIIAFNRGGPALYAYDDTADPLVTYNDFWANEGGDFGGAIDPNDPNWVGNIFADPLLADDGFHLLCGSPCIDRGDLNLVAAPGETDIDGQARIIDANCDPPARILSQKMDGQARIMDGNCDSIIDMGADERPPCKGDLDGNCFIMISDLFKLTSFLGQAGPPYIIVECDPLWNPCADMDDNGFITVSDLFALIALLGRAGPPYIIPCP